MHIAVFGGTRGVGRAVIDQSLALGHTVAALARDPAKLDPAAPGLTVVAGDVLDPAAVAHTLAGADAVVVSLGGTDRNPGDVVSRGTQNVLAAMQAAGPRRLIVVSSVGVGDSRDKVPFAFKLLMNTVLRAAMQDKEKQEAAVRASGLDWTIVRPVGLTDEPATGAYRITDGDNLRGGRVARADVAAFVVQQLDSAEYVGKTPAVS